MPEVLKWDQDGERLYETGVEKGVLFPYSNNSYQKGVAWNGLTAVNESPSGAEATPLYADNKKYLNLMSNEDFGFTIEAYMSPVQFDACDGSASLAEGVSVGQQTRQTFGFSYQTKIGSDDEGTEKGYKIHLVYGCLASPSERSHSTINESPEASTLSWTVSTTPIDIPGMKKPSAHIVIDSTKVDPDKLEAFEEMLYGSSSADSKLPTPAEVIAAFAAA